MGFEFNRVAAQERGEGTSVVGDDPDFQNCFRRIRNSWPKRLIDLSEALVGLAVLSPFLLLVALAILLDGHGAQIYRQRRTGLDGRVFRIFKFRTLRVREVDCEVAHAAKLDERVTCLGRFLRESNIYELPQLINVVKGDMSLVGPRPHAVRHDAHYGSIIENYGLRFAAMPGMTGLAQVQGCRGTIEGRGEMAERLALDLEYIKSWSLIVDLEILLRTVFFASLQHPLRSKGAR